jgi:hypothetical protein
LIVVCTSKVATESFGRKVQADKQRVREDRKGFRAVSAMSQRQDLYPAKLEGQILKLLKAGNRDDVTYASARGG